MTIVSVDRPCAPVRLRDDPHVERHRLDFRRLVPVARRRVGHDPRRVRSPRIRGLFSSCSYTALYLFPFLRQWSLINSKK